MTDEKKPEENETNEAAGLSAGLGTVADLGWMGGEGTHFHCKECGHVVDYVAALHWKPIVGVRRLGICQKCELMLIQSEHKKIRWIKI